MTKVFNGVKVIVTTLTSNAESCVVINDVLILDYDKDWFFHIQVIFFMGKEAKVNYRNVYDDRHEAYANYADSVKNSTSSSLWRIKHTLNFNPTMEMLTDKEKFNGRFLPLIGLVESISLFNEINRMTSEYQIKTAIEGSW